MGEAIPAPQPLDWHETQQVAVNQKSSQHSCLESHNPQEAPRTPPGPCDPPHAILPSKYRNPSPCPIHLLAEGKVQNLSRVAPVVSQQAASPSVPEAHDAIQTASVNHSGARLPQQLHDA